MISGKTEENRSLPFHKSSLVVIDGTGVLQPVSKLQDRRFHKGFTG